MTETPENTLLELSSRKLFVRIMLVLAALCALLFGWFSVRWQIGNLLAEQTRPNEPNARQIAELALRFSSGDPAANWLLTTTEKNEFDAGEIQAPVGSFQQLVRLSPNKFNWWIELGRTYEQANQPENAEAALLHAVELAPNYTYPHWQLGNFYLRQGKEDAAFAELRRAAENNPIYRDQVFSIAWEFHGQDTRRLEALVGSSGEVKASLAKFYAIKERAADSLRVWDTMSEQEKQANADIAKIIAQGLFDKRFYPQAVEFVRDLGIEPNAAPESIQNGGFEYPIGEAEKTYFNWQTSKIEKMEIRRDRSQKKFGEFSLRVVFSGLSQGLFFDIAQIVTVRPGIRYRVSYWLRTENLKSGGMPVLEIVDSKADKIIATSESFPSGTSDWRQVNIDFTGPSDSNAVWVRTSRGYCGDYCPIVGAFWYDGFEINTVN